MIYNVFSSYLPKASRRRKSCPIKSFTQLWLCKNVNTDENFFLCQAFSFTSALRST